MNLLIRTTLTLYLSPIILLGQGHHLCYPDTLFLSTEIKKELKFISDDRELNRRIIKEKGRYIEFHYQDSTITSKSNIYISNNRIVKWEKFNSYRPIILEDEIIGVELMDEPTAILNYSYENARLSCIEERSGEYPERVIRTTIYHYNKRGKVDAIKTKESFDGKEFILFEKNSTQFRENIKTLEEVEQEYISRIKYFKNGYVEKIFANSKLLKIIEVKYALQQESKTEYDNENRILSTSTKRYNNLGKIIFETYETTEIMEKLEMDITSSYSNQYQYSKSGDLCLIKIEYDFGNKSEIRIINE